MWWMQHILQIFEGNVKRSLMFWQTVPELVLFPEKSRNRQLHWHGQRQMFHQLPTWIRRFWYPLVLLVHLATSACKVCMNEGQRRARHLHWSYLRGCAGNSQAVLRRKKRVRFRNILSFASGSSELFQISSPGWVPGEKYHQCTLTFPNSHPNNNTAK